MTAGNTTLVSVTQACNLHLLSSLVLTARLCLYLVDSWSFLSICTTETLFFLLICNLRYCNILYSGFEDYSLALEPLKHKEFDLIFKPFQTLSAIILSLPGYQLLPPVSRNVRLHLLQAPCGLSPMSKTPCKICKATAFFSTSFFITPLF